MNTRKRWIGIQHRVKFSAEGEARPTMVTIIDGDTVTHFELATEQSELDFVIGKHPSAWGNSLTDGLNLDDEIKFPNHQLRLKKLKAGDAVEAGEHIRLIDTDCYLVTGWPIKFDGLQPGDTVAMVLGGSGDYLAYAFARQAEKVGAEVVRIPSFILKREREVIRPVRYGEPLQQAEPDEEGGEKRGRKKETTEGDDNLLARLARDKPHLFYPLAERDRELIVARESWRALNEAMKARMACEQRLRQLFIGRTFTQPDGLFPEGGIENRYDEVKASDTILGALEKEEKQREKDLGRALEQLPIYRNLFKPIPGVGPKIAGRIIAAVVDIRRFETDAKLKKFMGVHVLEDGRFPRQRHGEVANWHGDGRQALYLLVDQFNRRPDSEWGKYLRKVKADLKQTHPNPVEVPGKKNGTKVKRWTDGHIHKTALWRTATRFAEHLHRKWTELDARDRAEAA